MTDRAPKEERLAVRIADVVQINPDINKSALGDDDLLPFVPMPAVEAETGQIDTSERRAFARVKSGFTSFATGDILFAKITPCMENGKMAIVPELAEGVGFGSTEFHVLRPTPAIDGRYLYYFVSSSSFRHEAQHNMSGAVGQKRVPKPFVENKEIPLPPLNEQRRIVEKIETLFARLDKGEEAVREVQRLLTRYRQSVLKSAVTGELTADWRAERAGGLEHGKDLLGRIVEARRDQWDGRGRYKVAIEAFVDDVPALPHCWTWATVDQVTGTFGNGLSKKPSTEPNQFPILRISATRPMKVSLDDLRFYTPAIGEGLDKYWVRTGDLLFTRYNGSAHLVGVCGQMRDETAVLHPDKLIKARPVEIVDLKTDYLELAWNCGETRKHIARHIKTTSGQQGISGSDIKAAPFPLPSGVEQAEIAVRVSEAFAKADALEAWSETEIKRSASLRQSILKDAFAGHLVPQDPSDEPASELLARIAAEKAPSKKTRRKVLA
ncbi:MAG: restriction endonuclease subunit S [Pseudomonadota bacterium]